MADVAKISIELTQEELRRLDCLAERQKRSRTALIREAIFRYAQSEEEIEEDRQWREGWSRMMETFRDWGRRLRDWNGMTERWRRRRETKD